MENTLWQRQRQLYSSMKSYRNPKHPAVLSALEQYNKELSVATPADKQTARLMEKAWHVQEEQNKMKEAEAPQVARRRRLFGIF